MIFSEKEGIAMAAYSQDLRDRVLRARERGESPTEVARRFEVSRVWVYQVWAQYQETGQRRGLKIGGYRNSRLGGHDDSLRTWIKEEPDITLVELRQRLKAEGIEIGIPALWHHLNQMGLTFKKNAARRRARTTGRAGAA